MCYDISIVLEIVGKLFIGFNNRLFFGVKFFIFTPRNTKPKAMRKLLLCICLMFIFSGVSAQKPYDVTLSKEAFVGHIDFLGYHDGFYYAYQTSEGRGRLMKLDEDLEVEDQYSLNELMEVRESENRALLDVFLIKDRIYILSAKRKMEEVGVGLLGLRKGEITGAADIYIESVNPRRLTSGDDRRKILSYEDWDINGWEFSPDSSRLAIMLKDREKAQVRRIHVFDEKFDEMFNATVSPQSGQKILGDITDLQFDKNNRLCFVTTSYDSERQKQLFNHVYLYDKKGELLKKFRLNQTKKKSLRQIKSVVTKDNMLVLAANYDRVGLGAGSSRSLEPVNGEYVAKIDLNQEKVLFEKFYGYSRNVARLANRFNKDGVVIGSEAFEAKKKGKILKVPYNLKTVVLENGNILSVKTFYRYMQPTVILFPSFLITCYDESGNMKWIREINRALVQSIYSHVSMAEAFDQGSSIMIVHNELHKMPVVITGGRDPQLIKTTVVSGDGKIKEAVLGLNKPGTKGHFYIINSEDGVLPGGGKIFYIGNTKKNEIRMAKIIVGKR